MRRAALTTMFLMATTGAAIAAPHGMYLTPSGKAALHQDALGSGSLNYYGGPVISKVKVVVVLWGPHVNATVASGIGGFFSAATNSTWFDQLSQYQTNLTGINGHPGTNQTISRGTYSETVTITPSHKGSALKDKQVQAEIAGQVAKGVLPKPDANTIYMTYFPPGVSISLGGLTSCSSFGAYHEGFTSKTYGGVFYGIMPDCGYDFSTTTIISAHELAEAVSDAFPTPGSHPNYPQAWNTSNGSETGDLCEGTSGTLVAGKTSYQVQQIYSNKLAGCTTGNYTSP